jgi:glycosyltransferase involved in cell wall biosynthesis
MHDAASLTRLSGWRRRLYELFWVQLPLLRSSQITVVSETTRRELEPFAVGTGARIRTIPNCVTLKVEDSLATESPIPRVLQIGTAPNKNLERVILALQHSKCKLVIVGKLSSEQMTLLHDFGVSFENHVGLSDSEIVDQYRSAAVLVYISTYEGFGLPILEAQAMGVPVVTSNREPMRSIAGVGAILVDPDNTKEVRSALTQVLIDRQLRERLVTYGKQNIEMYSPERIAQEYCKMYDDLKRANQVGV